MKSFLSFLEKNSRKIALILLILISPGLILATSADDLQNQINNLQQDINSYQNKLNQTQQKEHSLQTDINDLNQQITTYQTKISDTQDAIDNKQKEIVETENRIKVVIAQLKEQRQILNQSIVLMYQEGDIPFVETLFSSKTFSDALDRVEYFSTIELTIDETIQKIQKLQSDLEDQQAKQEKEKENLITLKEQVEAEAAALANQRAEKDQILAYTQGQEEKYKDYLAQAEAEAAKTQAQLAALYDSGQLVSQGKVKRGDVIGREGSTGFSTGCHLHFAVYSGNLRNDVDPMPYINNGTFSYPLDYFVITQNYWGTFSHRGRGWPGGLDMAGPCGEPVHAAADGDIVFNGWMNGGFGHYVIIDHNNGLYTLYAHMLP